MQTRAFHKIMHHHTKQHLKPHHVVFNTTFLPASDTINKMTISQLYLASIPVLFRHALQSIPLFVQICFY